MLTKEVRAVKATRRDCSLAVSAAVLVVVAATATIVVTLSTHLADVVAAAVGGRGSWYMLVVCGGVNNDRTCGVAPVGTLRALRTLTAPHRPRGRREERER